MEPFSESLPAAVSLSCELLLAGLSEDRAPAPDPLDTEAAEAEVTVAEDTGDWLMFSGVLIFMLSAAVEDGAGFRSGLSAFVMWGMLNSGVRGGAEPEPELRGGMSFTFMVTFWGMESVCE